MSFQDVLSIVQDVVKSSSHGYAHHQQAMKWLRKQSVFEFNKDTLAWVTAVRQLQDLSPEIRENLGSLEPVKPDYRSYGLEMDKLEVKVYADVRATAYTSIKAGDWRERLFDDNPLQYILVREK